MAYLINCALTDAVSAAAVALRFSSNLCVYCTERFV